MNDLHIITEDILRALTQAHAYRREVGERLQWLLHYAQFHSVTKTCKHFGIARSTFYRWARRFNADDLSTLEDSPTMAGEGGRVSGEGNVYTATKRAGQETFPLPPSPEPCSSCFFCRLRAWWSGSPLRSLLCLSMMTNLALVGLIGAIVLYGGQLMGDPTPVSPASAFEPPQLSTSLQP